MKKILLFFLLIFSFSLFAQENINDRNIKKGVETVENKLLPSKPQTYAILIGVSDYQNVRDLQYADRDAEVFYGYLNEVAKVPKKNIFLFTNQKANLKNISRALTQLDTAVKSGDKFIFFFAGHGDIEAENRPDETALLLLHDSPNGNYLASQDGYIKLIDLKEAFDKFTEKNASVLFFADACRSGAFNLINNNYQTDTLKGGVRGKNRFLKGIQQPWLNQIKYVSCQVNENSLEGSEFSCGRGLFSLHLVDGLMGMADKNSDKKVSFKELQNYVEEKVTSQALPRIQSPQKVNGNDIAKIASVDSMAFSNYQAKQKQFERTHQGDCSPFISGINIKGDSISVNEIEPRFRDEYISFYKYLKDKKLIYPENQNAKKTFEKFTEQVSEAYPDDGNPLLSVVTGNMKADFIEALQKGCMNIIKPLLIEVEQYNPPKYAVYDTAHRYMSEALKLITKEHFLYNNYLARDLYLQMVLTVRKPNNEFDYSDYSLAKADSLLKKSLTLEPDMPYVYSALGNINSYLSNYERALFFYKKGFELMPQSPVFVNMMAVIADAYGSIEDLIPQLKNFPNDPSINGHLAKYYTFKNDVKQAKYYLTKAINLHKNKYKNSKTKEYYLNLTTLYKNCNDLDISIIYADSCYRMDSTSTEGLFAQMTAKLDPNNLESANFFIKKMVKLHPDFGLGHSLNALMLSREHPILAIQEAKISFKYNPNNYFAFIALIESYSNLDSLDKSYEFAKKFTQVYPKSGDGWHSLGDCLEKLKKNDFALNSFMKADSLKPKTDYILSSISRVYENLKNYQMALNYGFRELNLNQKDARTLSKIGRIYSSMNEHRKSITYYRYSLKINPKISNVNNNLAFIYWNKLNKPDSAIYFFKKEIENDPEDIGTNLMIGLIYEKMQTGDEIENKKKALEYYQITLKGSHPSKNKDLIDYANLYISNLYIQNGEFQKAIPYSEQLSRENPSNLTFQFHSFISYFRSNQFKKADSMIVFIQKEIPNIKEPLKLGLFGSTKYRVKNYIESEKYYKQSLELIRDTNNLTGYSLVLIRLDKFKEADEILKGIISKHPEDLIPILNYGFSLTIQKRYDEAKKIFEQAEKLNPKDNILYFRWASFYAAQKKDQEALEQIKKAIDLGFKDFWRFDDEEFEMLRSSPDFQTLINTYFKKK